MNGTVVLGRAAIPEWEISGFVEYIKAGQKQGDMLLVVPEGAFAVRLGNEAFIKQRVKVSANFGWFPQNILSNFFNCFIIRAFSFLVIFYFFFFFFYFLDLYSVLLWIKSQKYCTNILKIN